MKRRALRICAVVLLLGGGAIVNVAVAWGSVWVCNQMESKCGIATTPDRGFVMRFTYPVNEAVHLSPEVAGTLSRPPDTGTFDEVMPDWGESFYNEFREASLHPDESWVRDGIGIARGYPMLSLDGYVIWKDGIRGDIRTESHVVDVHAFVSRFQSEQNAWLPLRPIWPGFAINTVFYAVILWGLFAAPFALRRRSRIKRGLCPKCAYPIGSSDVCTECGAEIAIKSTTPCRDSPR